MEKVINDFPNYTITNNGDIYSTNYNNTNMRRKLLLRQRNDGYITVCLSRNGKKYDRYLHILVAEHFIPNPDNLPQVNHKDGDKSNCHDWNLEWCTNGYNLKHAHSNGLRNDRQHLLMISKTAVDKISKCVLQLNNDGTTYATHKNAVEASKSTGINRRGICACCNGEQKMCGGWAWVYKEV